MATELEALREKHAKEIQELEQRERVLALLPEAVRTLPWRYYRSALYGTTGALYVAHNFYAYGREEITQPTLDTVGIMARAFPAEPLKKIRDGSLSFRAAAYVDALPEEKKVRWNEEQDVAPFTVKVSGFQQYTYEIGWNAMIAGELTRVHVMLPLPFLIDGKGALGRLEIRYKKYVGGRRVERCEFQPADRLQCVYGADGEPLAQLERPIKWASGSDETPNDFTLYWVALGEGQPGVEDLVRAIQGEEGNF